MKMTVILKLQGLDARAGAEDIRSFFQDLHIPDGGVYIIGGKLREAFIAFTAERDAQLAMRHNGQVIKASKVSLTISSLQEVEKKLRVMLEKKKKPFAIRNPSSPVDCPQPRASSPPAATASSLCEPKSARPQEPIDPQSPKNKVDSSTAFLLGCFTVLQSLQPHGAGENNDLLLKEDIAKIFTTDGSNDLGKQAVSKSPGFVRLFGLPPSVTKEEICDFFRGLNMEEVIVNVELGVKHGCLVRFSNEEDASSALLYNQRLLGSNCVEVRGGTEKMWAAAMQNHQDTWDSRKTPNLPLSENANQNAKMAAVQMKRPCVDGKSSYPPQKRKTDFQTTAMSPDMGFTVMISNLPETMTKTDIKLLLGCRNMMHKDVLHLLDKQRQRTDKAFVTFKNVEEYDHALKLTGCLLGSNVIQISAISRERMNLMLAKTRLTESWIRPDSKKIKTRRKLPPKEKFPVNPSSATTREVNN